MKRALLREYIKEVLTEDMGGDYAGLGLGDAMVGPYGMHYASGEQLKNIFIKPFTDVLGVAAGKTKELSTKAQTVAKVAFEAVATSVIPWLTDSYEEIFADEKDKIDKIRSEYSAVYNATWDAFKENDVLVAAFMYRPDLFLTVQLARKAPQATAKLLSVLTGGALDNVLAKFKVSAPSGKKDKGEGPGMPFESVIREEDGDGSPLQKLVSNKKVKQAVANSPTVQQMTKVGQGLVQDTLKKVASHAQSVVSAKSLQDLQQKIGKKLPGLDKLANVPQEERQKVEQALLASAKKGMKDFYIKNLEGQVKAAVQAGVPQEHPYVQDYVKVISKIKGM